MRFHSREISEAGEAALAHLRKPYDEYRGSAEPLTTVFEVIRYVLSSTQLLMSLQSKYKADDDRVEALKRM